MTKPKPVMYMDVDGVLNFFGSRTSHGYRSGNLGYLRRNSVYEANENRWYPLNWSAELTRKLAALPADWVWLSSWKDLAVKHLNPLMEATDATWLDWEYSEATGWNHALKFEALLRDQASNPRPFVWVDDEATSAFDTKRLPLMYEEDESDWAFDTALMAKEVPHLVLTPKEAVGMTRDHLDAVTEFVLKHR